MAPSRSSGCSVRSRPGNPARPTSVRCAYRGSGSMTASSPFVAELIKSPGEYLEADRKKPAPRPAKGDPSLVRCKIALAFDSGETFHERFLLKAASPALATSALGDAADARLSFLANTGRMTRLAVPGCRT